MSNFNYGLNEQRAEELFVEALDKQSPLSFCGYVVPVSRIMREMFPSDYEAKYYSFVKLLIGSGMAPSGAIHWVPSTIKKARLREEGIHSLHRVPCL